MGFFDKTVDEVSFDDRWKCSAHTSGSKGGHDINLMDLADRGLKLCGSVKKCLSDKIIFNDDLFFNLNFSDKSAINWSKEVDVFIRKNNLMMSLEKISNDKRITKRNLLSPIEISIEKNIRNIIWSTGFRYDFNWIKMKVTDEIGHPIQKRGVTKFNGFYFMGLQWMHTSKSAQFIGVGEDAKYIVNDIISKQMV